MSLRPGVKFHKKGSCDYIFRITPANVSLVVDSVVLFFFSFFFSFFLLNITPNLNAGIYPHWPRMTSQEADFLFHGFSCLK